MRRVRGFIHGDGLLHWFVTWRTAPDESDRITNCGVYIDSLSDRLAAWFEVPAGPDTFLTCIRCVGRVVPYAGKDFYVPYPP